MYSNIFHLVYMYTNPLGNTLHLGSGKQRAAGAGGGGGGARVPFPWAIPPRSKPLNPPPLFQFWLWVFFNDII